MPRTAIVSTFAVAVAISLTGAAVAQNDNSQPQQNQSQSQTGNSESLSSRINNLPDAEARDSIDRDILHAQVLLDAAGFSPGAIDAREGKNFEKALTGYQEANGLEVTGTLDEETKRMLMRDSRQPTRTLKITKSVVDRDYTSPFPDSAEQQAELDALNYRNMLEEVAERFHTTPEVIIALNGGDAKIGVGHALELPNVLPTSRDFEGDVYSEYSDWFNMMNVNADVKKGDRIEVDESEGMMRVFDGEDQLIATFPVTTGSENDPLPIGNWEVTSYAFLPPFSYQPDLFWDVPDSEEEQMLPPGPNGPVGVAWLDLTKEHYGVHGTGEPTTIGYAQSHGCLRMTNWDVLKLSYMMNPGFSAEFVA